MRFFWSFRGRLGRSRYWQTIALATVLFVAIGAFPVLVGPKAIGQPAYGYVLVAGLVVAIAGWKLCLLSVVVRRLHDLNQSGWVVLALLLVFVPAALVLGCIPGNRGPNRFDADPLVAEP